MHPSFALPYNRILQISSTTVHDSYRAAASSLVSGICAQHRKNIDMYIHRSELNTHTNQYSLFVEYLNLIVHKDEEIFTSTLESGSVALSTA